MQNTCLNCHKNYKADRQKSKHCSLACHYDYTVKSRGKWEDCFQCLAIVGFNVAKTSELTGKDSSTIRRARKKYGWRQIIPKCKTWGVTKINPRLIDSLSKSEIALYLTEYNPRFPEWKASHFFSQYELMTKEQKKVKNQKITASRKSSQCRVDSLRLYLKKWREKNKETLAIKRKEWIKGEKGLLLLRKYRKYPVNKIKTNLRKRMKILLDSAKTEKMSVSSLIGCNSIDFRRHIEKQFTKCMTWDNYGSHWHIDHILPCASFDHSDKRQIAQCWHFTNLRPLKAIDNIMKSDTITHPQMQLLL